MSRFETVRDIAVNVGRAATVLSLDDIDKALQEGQRAETVGAIIDPTLFIQAGESLTDQIKYLQAFRDFRSKIEEFQNK